jgi:hypothetical protein
VTNKSGCTLERTVKPKMADIPVSVYQAFWMDTYRKLKSEYQQLIGQFPDANAQLKQLFKVICDIEEMARYTPASVGEMSNGHPLSAQRRKTGRTSANPFVTELISPQYF